MKKIYTLLMAALTAVLVFTACGNEPAEPQDTRVTLIRNWECTSATILTDGEETPSNYLIGTLFVINGDGTALMNDEQCNYDYNESDSTIVLHWDLNGEQWDEPIKVLSLTSTELKTYEKIVLDDATGHNNELFMTYTRKQ